MELTVKDDKTLLLERRIRHLENELELTRREKEEATQKYFEFYSQLEDLIKERTADLHRAHIALEEKNQSLQDALGLVEKANATRSGFLANVSHELRTPLNAILGFAQILAEEKNKENSASLAYIGHIIKSANNLSALIDDLIALSKLEAGVMALEEKEVRLHQIFNSCWKGIGKRLQDRNIIFDKIIPKENPLLYIDLHHIRRILFHLFDNAIRYTENGRIMFEVKIGPIRKERTNLTFVIVDNGSGIPAGLLKNIRAYFKKASSATNTNYEGLGIGLVLCRLIAGEMGGHLDIQSIEGQGTEVSLHLKDIKILQKDEKNISGEKHEESTHPLCNSFMVIDDTEQNITLLRHYYEGKGIKVLGATSVKKGLALARKTRPDLILMDINMPEIDGFEGLKMFKSIKEFEQVPVIAFSASNDAMHVEKARQAGFDDYLLKPVDFPVLTGMLQQYSNHDTGGVSKESNEESVPDLKMFPGLAELRDRFEKHIHSPVLSEIKETLVRIEELTHHYNRPELEKWYERMSNAVEQFDMGFLNKQFHLLTEKNGKQK